MVSTVVFDFDSTIIPEESLDYLLSLAVLGKPDNESIIRRIEQITQQCMEGKIEFSKSLSKRFALASVDQSHIESYIDRLHQIVDAKMVELFGWLKMLGHDVWIVSGGFDSWIAPFCVKRLGIPKNKIIANRLSFNNGYASTFDPKSPLIQNDKSFIVKSIIADSSCPFSVMIGDGMTDYAVYKSGVVCAFIGVGIYARRINVRSCCKHYIESVDQLSALLKRMLNE